MPLLQNLWKRPPSKEIKNPLINSLILLPYNPSHLPPGKRLPSYWFQTLVIQNEHSRNIFHVPVQVLHLFPLPRKLSFLATTSSGSFLQFFQDLATFNPPTDLPPSQTPISTLLNPLKARTVFFGFLWKQQCAILFFLWETTLPFVPTL